jgi:uncharacterized protein YPO0396
VTRSRRSHKLRERYLELETGITLSLKEVLEIANHKEGVWKAADDLRSLLVDIADAREEQAQELQLEAQAIRECVKKYDAAEEALDVSTSSRYRGLYRETNEAQGAV